MNGSSSRFVNSMRCIAYSLVGLTAGISLWSEYHNFPGQLMIVNAALSLIAFMVIIYHEWLKKRY